MIAYKTKKPPTLQGFHTENNEIPELDTFEEFCSNIPDQDNLEINFSKPSQDSRQMKSENQKTNESKSSNNQSYVNSKKRREDSGNIQYIEFVEFNNSEQTEQSQGIQEPPAPQNKNTMKFCFPQKCDISLKKQLSMQQTANNNESQSATEQTLLKQQSFDNKIKQRQISEENSKQFETICLQLSEQNKNLEKRIIDQEEVIKNLIQENLALSQQLQEKHVDTFIDANECLSNNEKLAYLIQKLNLKCQENAKLKYEIIKLQNNIELQETTQLLKLNQPNQFFIDTSKAQHSHSPNLQSQSRGQHSLSKESKTSLTNQPKQQPFSISISNQFENKTIANLSNMISPLSRCAQIIQQRQSQQIQRNSQYQEDIKQKKNHIKNSTSVGELGNTKQDLINYSNIIHRILRKESYSISSPEGRATQKFKQALNEKLNNLQQENSKSYTNSLMNEKLKETYLKPKSPKRENKKQNQLFGFMNPPHPNTRKQSDLLKSEESHRSEIGQISDKKRTNQPNTDVFQIMKEIRNKKVGISTQQIRPLITEVKSTKIKH